MGDQLLFATVPIKIASTSKAVFVRDSDLYTILMIKVFVSLKELIRKRDVYFSYTLKFLQLLDYIMTKRQVSAEFFGNDIHDAITQLVQILVIIDIGVRYRFTKKSRVPIHRSQLRHKV